MLYNLLYDYQKKTVDELKNFNSCGLFFDVGCGKSITSLALYEDKLIKGKVNKLIIVCLCAKITEWKYDCERWFPFSKVIILDNKKQSKEDFINENFDIAIINFEKTWRYKDLRLINNKYYIIIDESHKCKEPTTKVGKFMAEWSYKTPYKCILTATPMNNGYVDLYNQLYFIGLIDGSFQAFKDKYCIEKIMYFPGMKPFKKIIGYHNTEYLDMLVSKYTRYHERKIDDSLIPSEIVIPFELDKQYNKIARTRVYEDISLDKVSSKRIGLKSLCSGTIIGNALVDSDGNRHREYQLNTYKLDWVKSFVEDFNERVVIFYCFDHQRDQLYEMLKKIKRPVARYCAEYKEEDVFKNNDNAVILVQYKSGATGIDWLKQSYVAIFYSLPDSYLEFYQAKGRLNRHGQTKKPLYYLLVTKGNNSVDELNYKALKSKQDFNDEWFSQNFVEV